MKPVSAPRRLARTLLALGLALAAGSSVAAAPERIITLAPHLAELVCAAGGCNSLVAVGAYSNYPPQVTTLPQVGDVAQLNLEAVLALQPTRIITWQGGTPTAQSARLALLKLPVTSLRIESLDDVATALVTLGEVLGTQPIAAAAAAQYRAQLQALRQRYAQASPVRVLYQIETAPVYSINRASPISEAITLCGGVNVFAGLPTLAAPVTDEAVLAAQPELVVHGPGDSAAVAAYWARFAKAARVLPRRVAIHPDLIARAGPRLAEGTRQLCEAIQATRQPKARLP